MAHELTIRANGKAEMAFVGETPWHGLGQPVTKGASIGVWLKEAGMDWEAKTSPISVNGKPDPAEDNGYEQIQFADYKALYRSDDYSPLSIVGDGYKIVQPREVLEFFRGLVEQEGWHIHTAGTLRGGRKLWAMATNGEVAKVGKGDDVVRNIVLATSMDGSMRTTAMDTAVRVVCANTLALAFGQAKQIVQVSHRTEFDATLVRRTLGLKEDHFKTFMAQSRELAETPVNLTQARDCLHAIFGVEQAKSKKPKVAWLGNLAEIDQEPEDERESRSVARCLELFAGDARGAGLASARGTAWGLLNAVTEHVDHEMGRSRDTGYDAALFGRGRTIKQQALATLMEELLA